MIRGSERKNAFGDEGDDITDGVVINVVRACGSCCVGKVCETSKGPLVSDGKRGDGFDNDGMLNDIGIEGCGVCVADAFAGVSFVPRRFVVVAVAEVTPGGLSGAGSDDLGFLLFGFRADELEERCCRGGVDVVVENQELTAGADGAHAAAADDAKGFGGDGLELLGGDDGAVDGGERL